MTFEVVLKPLAEQDVFDAHRWYEEQSPGLGDRLIIALDNLLSSLSETPRMYQEVMPGVRRGLTRTFPFGVFYTIEDETVYVIAVANASRDPDTWQSRA